MPTWFALLVVLLVMLLLVVVVLVLMLVLRRCCVHRRVGCLRRRLLCSRSLRSVRCSRRHGLLHHPVGQVLLLVLLLLVVVVLLRRHLLLLVLHHQAGHPSHAGLRCLQHVVLMHLHGTHGATSEAEPGCRCVECCGCPPAGSGHSREEGGGQRALRALGRVPGRVQRAPTWAMPALAAAAAAATAATDDAS
jgi:hypothetical protein